MDILPKEDPLHNFLADEVLGLEDPVFAVQLLHPKGLMLRSTDRHSGLQVLRPQAAGRQTGHRRLLPPQAAPGV